MPTCPRCAVEVTEGTEHCPLCGAPPVEGPVTPQHPYPESPEIPLRLARDNPALRPRLMATLTVCLGLPLVTALSVDLLDGRITWSPYAVIPLASAWCYSGLVLYWARRPLRHYTAALLVTAGLLAGLDRCDGSWTWFHALALPILGALTALLTPFVVLIKHRRLRWDNGAGWGLLALALECLVIDASLQAWRGRGALPTWSLVVMVSLTPTGLFLLYLHHRLRQRIDLVKWFHV